MHIFMDLLQEYPYLQSSWSTSEILRRQVKQKGTYNFPFNPTNEWQPLFEFIQGAVFQLCSLGSNLSTDLRYEHFHVNHGKRQDRIVSLVSLDINLTIHMIYPKGRIQMNRMRKCKQLDKWNNIPECLHWTALKLPAGQESYWINMW